MIFGFTGTRFGMTLKQDDVVKEILASSDLKELHHGDCVGADAESHSIVASRAALGEARIVIHPPVDEEHRAFCKAKETCFCTHGQGRHRVGGYCWGGGGTCGCKQYVQRDDQVIILPAKTHFARNRDIVDASNVLVAAPYNDYEESKGGTWYTINYARGKGLWLAIVWPSGKFQEENRPKCKGCEAGCCECRPDFR